MPTVRGMAADGVPFTGFLYAGLMIDRAGAPKVIEFNVRFGDPETQPVMLRLQSDLLDLVEAAIDGTLDDAERAWDPRPSLGVVMAAAALSRARRASATRSAAWDAPDVDGHQGVPRRHRGSTAGTSSPPAAACCACARSATRSPRRSAAPMPKSPGSPGMANSIATTSAGARSRASGEVRKGVPPRGGCHCTPSSLGRHGRVRCSSRACDKRQRYGRFDPPITPAAVSSDRRRTSEGRESRAKILPARRLSPTRIHSRDWAFTLSGSDAGEDSLRSGNRHAGLLSPSRLVFRGRTPGTLIRPAGALLPQAGEGKRPLLARSTTRREERLAAAPAKRGQPPRRLC